MVCSRGFEPWRHPGGLLNELPTLEDCVMGQKNICTRAYRELKLCSHFAG